MDEDKVVVRSEDEVKASIIAEYGFDEEADAERIGKIVQKEIEHDKKLSSAIGAKIKHRTEADDLRKKIPPEGQGSKGEEGDNKDLTVKDSYALMEAKVPLEDIDEVVEYAKFKKISVTEALKSDIVKTTLSQKAEFRKTANATSANTNKRIVTKPDTNKLISDLSKGEVPEKGTAEAEEIFWARRGGRK